MTCVPGDSHYNSSLIIQNTPECFPCSSDLFFHSASLSILVWYAYLSLICSACGEFFLFSHVLACVCFSRPIPGLILTMFTMFSCIVPRPTIGLNYTFKCVTNCTSFIYLFLNRVSMETQCKVYLSLAQSSRFSSVILSRIKWILKINYQMCLAVMRTAMAVKFLLVFQCLKETKLKVKVSAWSWSKGTQN